MGKEGKQWSCELGSAGVRQGPPEAMVALQVSWQLQERDWDAEMLQDRSAERRSQGKKRSREKMR